MATGKQHYAEEVLLEQILAVPPPHGEYWNSLVAVLESCIEYRIKLDQIRYKMGEDEAILEGFREARGELVFDSIVAMNLARLAYAQGWRDSKKFRLG